MAERRPLTARDIKSTVEGYSEMSDEAFARRFYSDRTELIALGVLLHSQRDEFTGEELYTLRSENYSSELKLEEDELAAPDRALHARGPVRVRGAAAPRPPEPRPRPPRLRRGAHRGRRADRGPRPRLLGGDVGPSTKLENAISKQRTVKFPYYTIGRDVESERTVNPYALLPDRGSWYVIGYDHDRDAMRTFRVSRIRGDIRFATRRERDFRMPEEFEPAEYRGKQDWQFGDSSARRRSSSTRTPRGGSSA